MLDLKQAYDDWNLDMVEKELSARYPDAPPNTIAALVLFSKLREVEWEKLEANLDDVVERIKREWRERGW